MIIKVNVVSGAHTYINFDYVASVEENFATSFSIKMANSGAVGGVFEVSFEEWARIEQVLRDSGSLHNPSPRSKGYDKRNDPAYAYLYQDGKDGEDQL